MQKAISAKKSGFKSKLAAALVTLSAMSCVAHSHAYASVSGALRNAGINSSGNITNGLLPNLQKLVYIIMAIGGLWGVACLIVGGMLLAGSGPNPQKRTAGFFAICMAAVGIFVVYKAYDIASWAVGLTN